MAGNDSSTRLLLHFDGTLADVVDSALGGSPKTFTVGGSQSTAQRKFDYGSLLCNIGGPNCQIPANEDWDLDIDDWILDGWFYITETANPFLLAWYVNVDNYLAIERVNTAGGSCSFGFRYRTLGTDWAVSGSGASTAMLNQWRHVCLSRSGATIRLFIDGIQHATATLPNATWPMNLTLYPLYIGGGVERADRSLRFLSGYVDEVRLQVGSARTANFTPPVDAYQPSCIQGSGGNFRSLMAATQANGTTHQTGDLACSQGMGCSFTALHGASQAIGTTNESISGHSQGTGGACDLSATHCSQGVGGTAMAVSSHTQGAGGSFATLGFAASQGSGGSFAIKIQATQANGANHTAALAASQATHGTFSAAQANPLYLLYHAVGTMPNFIAAPAATSPTLPFDFSMTGAGLHYLVLRLQNAYFTSQNITPTIIELDGSDNEIMRRPSEPESFSVAAVSGAKVRVNAAYGYMLDEDRAADKWLIYVTNNGVDPDPDVDTPTVVDMVKINGVAMLDWASGAFTAGQTIKVLVRTRRTSPSRDSSNTTPASTTAATAGPTGSAPKAFQRIKGIATKVSA